MSFILTQGEEYPWVAELKSGNRTFCGASLIGSRFIFAAADCFEDNNNDEASEIEVFLGDHNLNVTNLETQKFEVAAMIRHENYVANNISNNIALLTLSDEVDINNFNTICLPEKSNAHAGEEAFLYGK